jgi:NAD(P)H-dependent FMN reductase
MLKLSVVLVSTRPVRLGQPIAQWFFTAAREAQLFDVDFVDLAEVNLPVLNEPAHPRQRNYQHQHTKDWSARVAGADAFAFVLPEYNFFVPPSFVNAIDYLYVEWNYKPCAFVSYGGVSGGLRSVQAAKQLVTSVKMMPIFEGVSLSFPSQSPPTTDRISHPAALARLTIVERFWLKSVHHSDRAFSRCGAGPTVYPPTELVLGVCARDSAQELAKSVANRNGAVIRMFDHVQPTGRLTEGVGGRSSSPRDESHDRQIAFI